MKIQQLSALSNVHQNQQAPLSSTTGTGKSFSGVLNETKAEQLWTALTNPASFKELGALQSRILQSRSVSPRELILYQVKASHFGLGIELVSKVAESVSASIKKFQSNP